MYKRQERGPGGAVAGTVAEVVLQRVARHPLLEERVEVQHQEEKPRQHHRGQQHVPHQRVAGDHVLPGRHQAQRALEEADVPVGLGVGGDLVGAVGPVGPYGVDLGEGAEEAQRARHHQQQARGLRGELRDHRLAHHVAVGPAGGAPLGVLEVHHEEEVHGDEGEEHAGHEHHVHDVQPRDDGLAGEGAPPDEEAQVGAHDGDGHHDAVRRAQPGPRQQVVRQGVAAEALQQGEEEQRHAHHPVELAGSAEGAGEEDPEHVDADGGDEDERRPVVDLPDEQPAAHVEAQAERRRVGLGHALPPQRRVRPLVDGLHHARVEEEDEVATGDDEHDEAVERELPEQVRPVVGEGLAQQRPGRLGGGEAPVQPHEAGQGRLPGPPPDPLPPPPEQHAPSSLSARVPSRPPPHRG